MSKEQDYLPTRVNTFSCFNPFILWMNGYVTGQYVNINERKIVIQRMRDKKHLKRIKEIFYTLRLK